MTSFLSFFLILALLPLLALSVSEDYYATLELTRDKFTKELCKENCRKLSKKYHPDKNSDKDAQERFIAVSRACEVLSDDEKRSIYDKYGEKGLEGEQGGDPFDVFAQFFGRPRNQGKPKGKDVLVELAVNLEDIYIGKRIELPYNKQQICSSCKGTGAQSDSDIVTCPDCQGQKYKTMKHAIGMGFFQQVQVQCEKCQAQGKIIKNKCGKCNGNRVERVKTTLVVEIEKGAQEGSLITLNGEGDQNPDIQPGSIHFQIKTNPNSKFIRKGDNLYMTYTLTLEEALFGFSASFKHLDGSTFKIQRNSVTQPDYVEELEDLGMPRTASRAYYGNLYVKYQVILPQDPKKVIKMFRERLDRTDL